MKILVAVLCIFAISCTTLSVWDADPRPSFIQDVANAKGIKVEDIKNTLLVVNEANISAFHLYEPADVCKVVKLGEDLVENATTWGEFTDFLLDHAGNSRILSISSIILVDSPKGEAIKAKDVDILMDIFGDFEKIYCK